MQNGTTKLKPDPRRALGDFGERIAARHLQGKGYRILDRNHRTREGEIDIIAHTADTVAFVEVRTRRGDRMGSAAESITAVKAARLVTLAEAYAADRPDLPEGRRIDLIAIDFARDGRMVSLQHFENAVTAD
jgi:putative endonuclease